MVNPVARYLYGYVAEGAADAYAEAAIATDLIPADGYAFEIDHIDFQLQYSLYALAADFEIDIAICRDSQVSMVDLDQPECFYRKQDSYALTTSGAWHIPQTWTWTPPKGVYIVEPNVYLSIDSAGTGVAITCMARIYYNEVKLSEVEILRLLNP
jgi:hypothetical protein